MSILITMKTNPNSLKNLKRGNIATQFKAGRQQSEIARKGGLKVQERLRADKQIQRILSMPTTDPKEIKQLLKMGFSEKECNNQVALFIALFKRAKKFDTDAAKLLATMLGELEPKEETSQNDIQEANANNAIMASMTSASVDDVLNECEKESGNCDEEPPTINEQK